MKILVQEEHSIPNVAPLHLEILSAGAIYRILRGFV